jgi:hypothetical protein
MTDDLRSIRKEIAQLRRGRPRTAVRYPEALRRRITTIARRCRSRRGGLAAVARGLGLPRWTLNLWLRTPAAPIMRAVALVPDPAPPITSPRSGPVLIAAEGVRIEGASVEELTQLLRALR